MPSTFLVSDFCNSQSDQFTETFSLLQNATLTFLGCPSKHTEINLSFDLIRAFSGPALTGNLTGSTLNSECDAALTNERIDMSSKSPTLRSNKTKRQQPELASQSNKKELARNQASQAGENSRRCREAKNTSLESGESQSKNGDDERVSTAYYESSAKATEKSPRRAASLEKNSHTDTKAKPQRKRSRERSGEVKALSRLRTCPKGLKQKLQASQLTETQISNMQLSRVLEQKALNMHRQLRLPKAQGDMEILSKGVDSFKHISETPMDSNSVMDYSNIRNYPGCSVETGNTAAEPCHSHLRSRTKGYPTIDKMFIDVLKTLIMQSGPESGSGITSIYDGPESCTACTYNMENEIGKSNNAVDVIITSDKSESNDGALSHEGTQGDPVSSGDKTGGAIRCDGDKNCNHSVVGYDEYEEDALCGFDADPADASEVSYDVLYQDVSRSTAESHEIRFRNTQDMLQRPKECINLSAIQHQSNATHTKCAESLKEITYLNQFSETLDTVLYRAGTIQFCRNHNNSVNDLDNSERTGVDEINDAIAAADGQAQGHLTGESYCNFERREEQSIGQGKESYNSIIIKLTPPSPSQPSSPQELSPPLASGSTFDRCTLLSVPEVYMSLRARLPSAVLLEMAADERFGSNDIVEKELEELCDGNGSRIAGSHDRPNSSQPGRNFITAYIEKAKQVLRNVRPRPVSPQNVLDKINKYCEKAKDEAKLIKSWSFSEVCKGGLRRSTISKFRFTDFKSKWARFQSDRNTDFKAEDAPEQQMPITRPGDAHSPIFCLNTSVKNDAAYDSEVESLYAPGSSQSYGAPSSSCRPQPILGRASKAAETCRIMNGCKNIQETYTDDETLDSIPEVFECRERKSAFFRYGETSAEVKVTTYPNHIVKHEALLEMNEESMPSSQQKCGLDELIELKVDTKIKRENYLGVERSANMQPSLSCSHVQHENANTESSQGQDDFSTSVPLKSQSLLQVSGATQGESSAVMSMLSEEVTLKRYPSFADLTDLNMDCRQKSDSSMEIKQGLANARDAESYDLVNDEQILTKTSETMVNDTSFEGCPEIELVVSSAEEAESKKLTPPNSPNLGVLVGARVQTIVSLLESCSALRTESEWGPNHSVHLEPNSRTIPCQAKKDETESDSPGNPDGCSNEISLPSPPTTSPGDSTSDTLDDTISPVETYEHCIASTSKSAAISQQRFKNRQRCLNAALSNNGNEFEIHTYSSNSNTCDEFLEKIVCKNMQDPDPGLDDLVSIVRPTNILTEIPSEEYPGRSRRNICRPVEIVTCKESDSFSLSASDSEVQLKGVSSQNSLSDEEEYLEQAKDVEIMRPTQSKCTKSCTYSRRAGDPSQAIKTQSAGLKSRIERKMMASSNQRNDAESSKVELKKVAKTRSLKADAVELVEASRSKFPRRIKWVTESPCEEDDMSLKSPASVTDTCDQALKQSKDKEQVNYPTQSANEAQGIYATPGPHCGTPDENDGTQIHSPARVSKIAAGSASGSKSDSNNNVSTPIENRWFRLYKGIPRNLKASKASINQSTDLDDKKVNAARKEKIPKSNVLSRRRVYDNDVHVDGMKRVFSLCEVSQVIGVPDSEEINHVCLSKNSDVSIISNDAASVNSAVDYRAASAYSVEFLGEDSHDYDQGKNKPYGSIKREDSFVSDPRKAAPSKLPTPSRPYCSVRREETFSRDPRKAAKRYEARSSQSLQLHEPVLSTLPPRPICSSLRTKASGCWKRSEVAGTILFARSSPDVSPEARDIVFTKGETCIVPKLSKGFWEGTTNLHGRENTKEHMVVDRPSPQHPSRLRSRLQRSEAKAALNARDFVQRSSLQIERCDKLIKKSTDTIRTSQVMVERSKKRLASTADEIKRLGSKYISIF